MTPKEKVRKEVWNGIRREYIEISNDHVVESYIELSEEFDEDFEERINKIIDLAIEKTAEAILLKVDEIMTSIEKAHKISIRNDPDYRQLQKEWWNIKGDEK